MSDSEIQKVKEWCTLLRIFANYTPNLETYNKNATNWINCKLNLPTIDTFVENIVTNNLKWNSDIGYALLNINNYESYFRPCLTGFLSGYISLLISELNLVVITSINVEEEAKLCSILKNITSEYHIQKLKINLKNIGKFYYPSLNFRPTSGTMIKNKCSETLKSLIETGIAEMEKKYAGEATANGIFTRLSLDSTRDVYDRLYEAYMNLPGCYKVTNTGNRVISCKLVNRTCSDELKIYTCDENEPDGCSNIFSFLLYLMLYNNTDAIAVKTLELLNIKLANKNLPLFESYDDIGEIILSPIDDRYTCITEFQKEFYKYHEEPWDQCAFDGSIASSCDPTEINRSSNCAMEYLPINMSIYPMQTYYESFIETLVDLSYGTGIDFLQVLALDERNCEIKEDNCNNGNNIIDKIENEEKNNYWLFVLLIVTVITIIIFIILMIFQSYQYKKIISQYQHDKAFTK